MNYRKEIANWFHLKSPMKFNHGAFGFLQKELNKLTKLYPEKAIYFSLVDIENDLKWINKKDFLNAFQYVKYILTVASNSFQENTMKIENDDKKDKIVEYDIDLIKKNEDRKVERKVKNISEFL